MNAIVKILAMIAMIKNARRTGKRRRIVPYTDARALTARIAILSMSISK